MLAKTFKSHIELGLTSEVYDALHKVLSFMEQGILVHNEKATTTDDFGFNMSVHFLEQSCGTVGCIVGWAGHFMGKDWRTIVVGNDHIYELFYPNEYRDIKLLDISVDEAALALRAYLETGNIDWSHVPELEYKDYDD